MPGLQIGSGAAVGLLKQGSGDQEQKKFPVGENLTRVSHAGDATDGIRVALAYAAAPEGVVSAIGHGRACVQAGE